MIFDKSEYGLIIDHVQIGVSIMCGLFPYLDAYQRIQGTGQMFKKSLNSLQFRIIKN